MMKENFSWNTFVTPHRKTMDMGNYTMHYIDIGQGEPVVMLHGMTLSTYSWRNNVQPLLGAGFRVILVDLPGHGQTDIPPEPYSYAGDNIAKNVIQMIDKLGIDQFNLMGHSMGAGMTLYMSIHYPQRVNKAIVIDAPAFGPPRRLLLTYPGMTAFASAFFGRWTVKMNMKAMYYDDSLVVKEMIDEYTRQIRKDGYWNMVSALSHQYFSSKFYKMQSAYQSMPVPVCIIWGEQDSWLHCSTGNKLQERIPNSRLITVPDCGHNPHEECPESVNPVIVEFLTKHD
jgi:pimeloyl-ACP methyl ester carboxylesterase